MAREFARMGKDLALCARRVERLEALQAELLAAHPDIRVVVRTLDVDDHRSIFAVFDAFPRDLGHIDRVIVNAGIARGQPLGTGKFFEANLPLAQTNFISALAQCEAAMAIFRAQGQGHLVTMSSMSAMRGMKGSMTVYSASKAALATLTEGIRAEFATTGRSIVATTVFPGYIRTDLNAHVKRAPFIVDCETGCRALALAIEREPAIAYVPAWPWRPLAWLMRRLPLRWLARLV